MKKQPTPKRRIGTPRTPDIDWEQARALCSIQCTQEEVAAVLGISVDSIYRQALQKFGKSWEELRKEWGHGGKASLRRKQWRLADTSATMAIFLGKQILGQRDDINLSYAGSVTQQIIHYGDEKPKTWQDEKINLD